MNISSNGGRCGRNFWQHIDSGTVSIDVKQIVGGTPKKVTYRIEKGEVVGLISRWTDEKGTHKEELLYGVGRKVWTNGKLVEVERYRKGSNIAKIFKGEWKMVKGKLEEFPVTFRRKCYGGSFKAEEARYDDNKKFAYKVSYGMRHLEVYYPDGKLWLSLTCPKGSEINFAWKDSILGNEETLSRWRAGGKIEMPNYDYLPMIKGNAYDVILYDQKGGLKAKGRCENRQKVGIWIENYETKYYIAGVSVSEKMFNAKPEELDCKEILNLDNIQLRTSLMSKVGFNRILKECDGVLVHRDGVYELWSIPIKQVKINEWTNGDKELKLLKVVCPSTGRESILKVRPTMMTCEEARKSTFGFNANDKVVFVNET